MRRLLIKPVIFMIIVLSLFPQVSAEFKEEKQGIEAAYGKIVKFYKGTATACDKASEDINVIQGRLVKTKEDIDKSMTYAGGASAKMSEYFKGFKSLAEEARSIAEISKVKLSDGYGFNDKVSLGSNSEK